MYFSDEIILITTDDSGTDEIGRQTETEMGRVTVYGDIKSVSREESFTAGSHGYSNVQKFVLHPWDYSGEKYAMVDGKRKLIYRTYQADPDTLELYAATKRGITYETLQERRAASSETVRHSRLLAFCVYRSYQHNLDSDISSEIVATIAP